jgi:hypothetical protein
MNGRRIPIAIAGAAAVLAGALPAAADDRPVLVVRSVPRSRSRLVAIRSWPLPAGDRRDPRLHRLFVIAYGPVGDPNPAHRLGIWITAFRNGYAAPWRLLQATVQPPGPTLRPLPHSRPVA